MKNKKALKCSGEFLRDFSGIGRAIVTRKAAKPTAKMIGTPTLYPRGKTSVFSDAVRGFPDGSAQGICSMANPEHPQQFF
jgi:hypothetical protein